MMFWVQVVLASPGGDLQLAEWRRDVPTVLETRDPTLARQTLLSMGRMRDPAGLARLTASLDDPELAPTAAFALGLIPGSASTVRHALTKLAAQPDRRESLSTEFGLRWQLVEALGRQGTKRDVGTLADLLQAHWPIDEAAARALLRLHRRDVDVSGSVPALIRALKRPDPRTTLAVAQGLVRIGVVRPTREMAETLRMHARMQPLAETRAALLKTVALSVDGTVRRRALEQGWHDLTLVRQTVLEQLVPEDGERFTPRVQAALLDPRQSIRLAAIGAAGRLGLESSLTSLEGRSPWEEAAVQAVVKSEVAVDAPWQVRAAAAPGRAVADNVAGALSKDAHPALRSASLSALMVPETPPEAFVKLLASPDAAVREGALAMLLEHRSPAVIEEVVLTLRVERDVNVVRTALELLLEWKEASTNSVKATRFVTSAVRREFKSTNPGVRAAAEALASALAIELPEASTEAVVRELILPDGTVTTTTGELPDILEVQRYQKARVHTNLGFFELALDPKTAPLAVHNFVSLSRAGFYDGLVWHRVITGFVAQGGCPRGDGWGGPGWTIVDEVSDRPFVSGAVGMARGARDTAGSQFFVMTGSARFLDGDYTRFGRVSKGMDVVMSLGVGDTIEAVELLVEGE